MFGGSGGGSAFGTSAAAAGLVSALACFSSACSVKGLVDKCGGRRRGCGLWRKLLVYEATRYKCIRP
jgi:hypothetical protein